MKNSTAKYKARAQNKVSIAKKFITLTLLALATAQAQMSLRGDTVPEAISLEISKKQIELKQHSLFSRILSAIEIRAHAGFGAGYFLSQFDPINPIYSPYTIRDRFSLSITLNISKILDNSTYKIKQIELQQLERKLRTEKHKATVRREILNEKISTLEEKIKAQSQIVELYKIYFNQNKISLEKLLEEKIKLLDLKLQLKEFEAELQN